MLMNSFVNMLMRHKNILNCSRPLQDAKLISDEYCAQVFADHLDQPRGLFVTPGNNILVIERGTGEILSLFDTDNDMVVDEIATIAEQNGLNHGIAIFGPHVYASTSSTVYRWSYTEGQKYVSTDKEVVVKNINANGRGGAPFGHTTRTIAFDKTGRLYVSVGSAGNVDRDSFRSRIRRFVIFSKVQPSFQRDKFALSKDLDFTKDGEVFADGVRNEVGYCSKHLVQSLKLYYDVLLCCLYVKPTSKYKLYSYSKGRPCF